MTGFWAADTSTTYDALTRCVQSPSGRVLLADVDLDTAARAFPGVPLRVCNTHVLAEIHG